MVNYQNEKQNECIIARRAHILYLTNITILPVVSFIFLIVNLYKIKDSKNIYLIDHYRQSILANLVAFFLLFIVSATILFLGGLDSVYTWMALILYFTCVHSVLILFGIMGIIKAQQGQVFVYPLFGRLWK